MQRLILRSLLVLLVTAAAIYAVDAITWHIRSAHGNGTDEVTVSQVSAASLKGKKEEYYFDGSITITCARSLMPQLTQAGWLPTCWYIRRNTVNITHV